jgi:Na+-transporting NADH:ubiquinone oxidoreductase subunit NqrE
MAPLGGTNTLSCFVVVDFDVNRSHNFAFVVVATSGANVVWTLQLAAIAAFGIRVRRESIV